MFDTADAKSSHSAISPKRHPKTLDEEIAETPDMNDLKDAIKVIGAIQRLIDKNHLVMKPLAQQRGSVKQGLIPIEDSRRFESRIGGHKKISEDESNDDDDNEDIDDEDEETRASKKHAKLAENTADDVKIKKSNLKVNVPNIKIY